MLNSRRSVNIIVAQWRVVQGSRHFSSAQPGSLTTKRTCLFWTSTRTIHAVCESFLIKVRIVTMTNWINSTFAPSEWHDSIMLTGGLSANCIMTWCLHVCFQSLLWNLGNSLTGGFIAVEYCLYHLNHSSILFNKELSGEGGEGK